MNKVCTLTTVISTMSDYIFNRVALAVREENGVVNCYHRTLN